jgi:hypothetical protein
VPHDVVVPKTGSKKKLVMQLDRDVQVCGILFLGFLDTPCFKILLLLLFWRGSCFIYIYIYIYFFSFLCSLIGAHFFYASLSIFSMTPLSFHKKRPLFGTLEHLFWWMGDMFS